MTNFPNSLDTDATLPPVNDNITEIGADAINALRDATFAIEQNVGINAQGSTNSIAARLGVSINPDGTLISSALTSLGLVTLPITESQIATWAAIPESKLSLNYGTTNLFNLISNLSGDLNTALGFLSTSGVKLEPHLIGLIYRHTYDQLDISDDTNTYPYFKNKFRYFRDTTNGYFNLNDLNNEFLYHQWADGTSLSIPDTTGVVTTNNGSTYPAIYGHAGSGIYIDSSTFESIPQTIHDIQTFADYIDTGSLLSVGDRNNNLFANGISRSSESSILKEDGYGQSLIPFTSATTYLSTMCMPVDDYALGDDIIQFNPSPDGYLFDSQFAQVMPGDIIRVNYGTIEVAFVIKEKKYSQQPSGDIFAVRIAGKNLFSTTTAIARIDKPLLNRNKSGVLATAPVNGIASGYPASLIVGNPKGAQAIGNGFDPSQFDASHYQLYLALFPTGNPADGYTILQAIDVTGNLGTTPGAYTLDGIVAATNAAFRQPGYNYRFIAFSYQGNFGIMLADSYNNASFSILSFALAPDGTVDVNATHTNFSNNVVDITSNPDPLGFGLFGANIASPPYYTTYGSSTGAYQYPTQLFAPLNKNTYYLNGSENSTLSLPNIIDQKQLIDTFGDGYWPATITAYPTTTGRTPVTYTININLNSIADLLPGKTIVVQTLGEGGTLVDFGRFIISSVNTTCGTGSVPSTTAITVWDAIHSTGTSPSIARPPAAVGTPVAIYFNSDSVVFSAENASDQSNATPLPIKRFFEVYIDSKENTYSAERGRLFGASTYALVNNIKVWSNTTYSSINIVKISPKLSGYQYGTVNKITFQLQSYDVGSGVYTGLLCNYDGTTYKNSGPIISGRVGQTTRFYDQTNIDYIDLKFDFGSAPNLSFTSPSVFMDIQLFPTLSLDKEAMLISSCQLNYSNGLIIVDHMLDQRQFGNISELELTTSALDYIAAPTRLLTENGIIRGLGFTASSSGTLSIDGGVAIINGKIVQVNTTTSTIPVLVEAIYKEFVPAAVSTINPHITWFVCVNSKSEIELVASTDFDPNSTTFLASNYVYGAQKLDHTRLFYAANPNVSLTAPFAVRGTYFADLVYNQTDLAVIGIVNATVTSSGSPAVYSVSSCTGYDARRFIANGYSGLSTPFVLGQNASFRSFDTINNWLIQLNNFVSASLLAPNALSKTVIIKGNIIVNNSPTLNYVYNIVKFIGDAAVVFTTSQVALNLGNNVSLENIGFNYKYDPFVSGDGSYLTITNGQYINAEYGCININFLGNTANSLSNIFINKCNFVWEPAPSSLIVNRYPFICGQYHGYGTSLSNIKITDNIFSSNLATQDDILGAIIFMDGYHSASPTAGQAVKLNNCTISGNKFDKNQIIAITAFRNSTNTYGVTGSIATRVINSAINCTNLIVDNNTCGVISVLGYYDISYSQSVLANEAPNSLSNITISNNNCLYIANMDGTCHQLSDGASDYSGNNINLITAPMLVKDNACSWIRVVPVLQAALQNTTVNTIKIINNILRANNLSFKNKFAEFGTTNDAISTGDPVNNSRYVGQTLIDGNNISQSTYLDSGPYYYNTGIYCAHMGTITNNDISGLDVGAEGIVLSNTCIVQNNSIYRGNTNISAYIDADSTGGHTPYTSIITNNTFDTATVDGSNELVVVNIGAQTICNQNINQTGWAVFPLSMANGLSYGSGIFSSNSIELYNLPSAVLAVQNGLTFVMNVNDGGANNNEVLISGDIGNSLPPGVQIVGANIGIASNTTSAATANTASNQNFLNLTLTSQEVNVANYSLSFNSIVDPLWLIAGTQRTQIVKELYFGAGTPPVGASTSTYALLRAGSVFLSSLFNDGAFITNGTQSITYTITLNINLATSSLQQNFILSPLVVRYRW